MNETLSRRQIIQLLGLSALAVHCGPAQDEEGDVSTNEEEDALTGRQLLGEIDHFVVLMMENRSFDHYLGALQRRSAYVHHETVDGTDGNEWNPSPKGNRVHIHHAKTYRLQNPPHTFSAAHKQWNDGKNDHFVIEHAGEYQDQVMAYYDAAQIPFYYWLAEHFTLFDRWHASVMGPTIPNRLYLNCGTSAGSKNNDPLKDEPETIWDQLRAKKISAKSFHAGKSGLMAHTLPKKTKAGHIPFRKIAEFYDDCKNGTLPSVSYIEPDYHTNCDHPVKDIRLGQAFVQHVYKRLAASPQWKKTVLFVLYDEHGGFWDHVSPPKVEDAHEDFRRFGFRVPAFAAGGIVKRGYLGQAHHDHTSVLATIAERFGLKPLSKRQENANPITSIFDAKLAKKETATAPAEPEPIVLDAEALETVGTTSQEELEATLDAAEIPPEYVDDRPLDERLADWLVDAQEVGAVKLAQ